MTKTFFTSQESLRMCSGSSSNVKYCEYLDIRNMGCMALGYFAGKCMDLGVNDDCKTYEFIKNALKSPSQKFEARRHD